MRLLHISDVHLGMVTHSWPDPATGIPSRILDVAGCLDAAVTAAYHEAVDAVVISGDVFHTASPDGVSIALFAHALERLPAPALIIPGNHDRAPHPNQPSVLEAFADGDWVTIATRPAVYEVGGVRIAAVPSVSRQLLSARADGTRAETDQAVVDALAAIIGGLARSGADVLTTHYSVAGAILGTERDIALIPEPMLGPADLAGPWRYVALGHIHRSQVLEGTDGPLIAYAGSVDRINFGEEREPKNALLVDIDLGRAVDVRQIELPARTFLTLQADAGEPPDVPEGAIVRVRGPEGDVDRWAAAAEGPAARVYRHPDRAPREAAVRMAEIAEVPGPLEALDRWMETREVPADRRPRLRECAEEVLV